MIPFSPNTRRRSSATRSNFHRPLIPFPGVIGIELLAMDVPELFLLFTNARHQPIGQPHRMQSARVLALFGHRHLDRG